MIYYQVYLCPALPSLLLCFISKFTPLFHYQFHKLASFQSLLTCQCLPSPLACFMIKSTRHDYAISNPLCGLCHLKPIMLIMLCKTHCIEYVYSLPIYASERGEDDESLLCITNSCDASCYRTRHLSFVSERVTPRWWPCLTEFPGPEAQVEGPTLTTLVGNMDYIGGRGTL